MKFQIGWTYSKKVLNDSEEYLKKKRKMAFQSKFEFQIYKSKLEFCRLN